MLFNFPCHAHIANAMAASLDCRYLYVNCMFNCFFMFYGDEYTNYEQIQYFYSTKLYLVIMVACFYIILNCNLCKERRQSAVKFNHINYYIKKGKENN